MKTHILYSNFFSENRTVYEVISKNVVETEGPQMTSQCGACVLRAGLARLCAHAHAQAPTCTHAHTDQCYTYIACLVINYECTPYHFSCVFGFPKPIFPHGVTLCRIGSVVHSVLGIRLDSFVCRTDQLLDHSPSGESSTFSATHDISDIHAT